MTIKERYDANFRGKLLLKKNENGKFYTTVKINTNTNKNVIFFDEPLIAHISATKNCNLNCYYCYAEDGYPKEDMSFAQYLEVIDKCNDNGVMILYWSGGEPFSNPRFVDLLEYAHKVGFYQTVLSNATLITNEQIDRIKNLMLAFRQVLMGYGKENKEGWLLDKAIENTSQLISNGIATVVTVIVKEFNKEKISEILEVCINNKITNIRFGFELPIGLNDGMLKSQYILNNRKFSKEFGLMKDKYKNKINISWQSEAKVQMKNIFSKRMLLCEAGTSQLYIDNNGDIYPCPLFKSYDEFNCGNVLTDDFKKAWYSENMNKLRFFDLKETDCGECNLICGSWCRGLVYSHSKNIKGRSHFCMRNN